MIDVHCLVHKPSPFFPTLQKQMQAESCVNFFVVDNGPNIGEGRAKGFSLGKSPLVSFVDYDDLIDPGIFDEINWVLGLGYDWCYTDEIIIDAEGNDLSEGWASRPDLYVDDILNLHRISDTDYCHHILAFRRELLTKEMAYIMRQCVELSEVYLKDELRRTSNYCHIDRVGYYWRIHGDNGLLKTFVGAEFSKNNPSIFRGLA